MCIFEYVLIWQKITTLRNFLKTSEILDNNARNSPWKFQVQNKFGSRDIHPQSSDFWENGQSGVQRSLYISWTVIATENLIRYSESTENFLSWRCHQIFAYMSSSGWKFDPKIGNFHLKNGLFWVVFGYFLGKYLKDFDKTRL